MKRNLLISGIILIIAFACKKNIDSSVKIEDGVLKVQDISFSDCKQSSKSNDNNEYLEYFATDSNYLIIKHVNVSLNCCPDSIKIVSSILNGEINYSVVQKESDCNCNCLHDITCKIGPLVYANYSMKVVVCTGSAAEFKIDFNKDTNGKYIFQDL